MVNKSAAQIKLELLEADWATIKIRDALTDREMLILYPDLADRIKRNKKELKNGL